MNLSLTKLLLQSFALTAALCLHAGASQHLSPSALAVSPGGTALYVGAATGNRVLAFDALDKDSPARNLTLPGSPGGLAAAPDGSALYVSLAQPDGKILVLDPASGKTLKTLSAGHWSEALALSPDGKRLAVCNRFDNDVSLFALPEGTEEARVPVLREPAAAHFTPDGRILVVANHLPTGPANGAYIAGSVSLVDPAQGRVLQQIPLPNGSHSLMDIAISPDGRYAYVSHILSRYTMPTTQLERGWMNTNALSIIDLAGQKRLNTVLLDQIGRGAANPWGVGCSPDGATLAVALSGTHEIALIDRAALHDRLERVARGEKVSAATRDSEDVPNDLAFLVDICRRIRMESRGPRALTWMGDRVIAAAYFSDTLEILNQATKDNPRFTTVALGPRKEPDLVRRGEMYFFDADPCFQQWQSCSSCHPGVRADCLNWDLLNDGIGNPKNTKSMLLAHATPPAMITGIRENAEVAVRAGIRHAQFAVRPESDAESVDAFLKSLQPVPSPALVNGELSEEARYGEKVFLDVGCASCHPKPLFTTMQAHDVGTGVGVHKGTAFDTPSLVECWRTAPYLYDGRAATLDDLLRKEKHGLKRDISEKRLKALITYLHSI